jgi:hypothetical protein
VFYELRARSSERIVVRVRAAGDLDAVVDVFRRSRSQLERIDCDIGDRRGRAELTFRAERNAVYLIRVGQRANSVAGNFRIDVFAPEPPPRPPGPLLAKRGVSRTLDAVQDTSDAWSSVLRVGVTYRMNLASTSGRCVSLALFEPGSRSFEHAAPLLRIRCGGYRLFTPAAGQGGRYAFLVSAQPRGRGGQRYHLQLARAGRDDTAPGLPLGDYVRRRGTLRGNRIDSVDLYRFRIIRRSDVRLTLRGGFTLQLVGDGGRRIRRSEGGEIALRMSPGRYYVAVRARADQAGRYSLIRATRIITATSVRLNGTTATSVPQGRTLSVQVTVTPAAVGPARVTIERFDPLAGWQFHRLVTVPVIGGTGRYAFTPPSEGRWRVTATFVGTRNYAPSAARYANVTVADPW